MSRSETKKLLHMPPDARAAKWSPRAVGVRQNMRPAPQVCDLSLRGFYGGKSATLAAIVDLQEIFLQSPFFICFFEENIVYYIGKSIARVAEWYVVSF